MPLAIDLFSGLGGWAEGLEAEGWTVIRFDIEDMFLATGTPKPDPCLLVLQDVCTIHGSQIAQADLIVSSSPCQDFSYRAMPWKRAKALHAPFLGIYLFWQQFRIQREACAAAGRHIPMVCENVRGAIPWVGRSRWHYGSYHLWGDVPALMPSPKAREAVKVPGMGAGWVGPEDPRHRPGLAFNPAAQGSRVREERLATVARADGRKVPGFRFDGSGKSFQTASVEGMKSNGNIPHIRTGARSTPHLIHPSEHVQEGRKHHGDWFRDPTTPTRQGGQRKVVEVAEGRKGAGAGAEWFDGNLCVKSSNSSARKLASAKIAKIPEALSRHIGRTFYPR